MAAPEAASARAGSTLTAASSSDVYVARLDDTGAHVWSRKFGASLSQQSASSITADSSDNVLFTGNFGGSVNFGGGAITSSAGGDVFAVQLSP